MIALIGSLLLSCSVSAQLLVPPTLEDQWGDKKALSCDAEWVILSTDKAGAGLVKEALLALNIKDLAAENML